MDTEWTIAADIEIKLWNEINPLCYLYQVTKLFKKDCREPAGIIQQWHNVSNAGVYPPPLPCLSVECSDAGCYYRDEKYDIRWSSEL